MQTGEGVATERSGIARRIADAAPRLSPAERRVAEVVIDDPKVVAFGTVAELATRSGASGPTVLRFANKLGFDGFSSLQAEVQDEIAGQLRPATERIRERARGDVVSRAIAIESENVRATLDAVDTRDFERAVDLLADRRRLLHVLAGDSARGLGVALAGQLDLLRRGVSVLDGSPVAVSRAVASLGPADVVVAIDLRRYERWVLEAAERATGAGASLIAITDGRLSPLVQLAEWSFVVSARGVGPFDSHVGAHALVNSLATGVAARLRRSAAARLDAIEAAWSEAGDLVDTELKRG